MREIERKEKGITLLEREGERKLRGGVGWVGEKRRMSEADIVSGLIQNFFGTSDRVLEIENGREESSHGYVCSASDL
ncbi:hypothetical protein L6452_00741 [Arctium lappa]|uniref:Uncharacterized protein n=1 Tax=Arctium lappa TaxID=4217 RepID=A0ACB9FG71_ARCLA|nr:hypothetical protein L6452_00741 [Arctium lappa]